MDFNLTGCFWGMPVNFSGDIAANFTAGTAATPSYITLGAALLGALVGGLITFFITYAKGRTEMKWSFKRDTVMAIINELDQSEARLPRTNQTIHRRVGHLINIAFTNPEIRSTADRISQNMALDTFHEIFDNELMPLIETDLEETINNWWKPWKW